MNRFQKIFYILLALFFIPVCQTWSAAAPKTASFQVDAKSAVLINGLTGKIVFEQNPDEKIAPASLIKITTLYLVYDAIDSGNFKTTDIVTISKNAWKFGGSQMFLEVGMQVPLGDIIKGIAVVSGNDACVAADAFAPRSMIGSIEAARVVEMTPNALAGELCCTLRRGRAGRSDGRGCRNAACLNKRPPP